MRQTSAAQHLVTWGKCPAQVLLSNDNGFSNRRWLHLLTAAAVAASGLTKAFVLSAHNSRQGLHLFTH